ncbi:MAG TPA: ABC transporter permease [Anaerolinea sp.]|nr:ABC transporter permease [Anaerolinea sp.]
MNDFTNTLWIELLKVRRSRVPWFSAVGLLILPLAAGFMMFVYQNPEVARSMGMISAKANLAGGSADWPFYLSVFAQGIAIGGIFLFGLAESWVFGREFSDGTLKDLLAVPVSRGAILLAKFVAAAVWSVILTLLVTTVGLALGALLRLPLGSPAVIGGGVVRILVSALLVMLVVTPVALFASVGRGYLLPLGLIVFFVAIANLIAIAGWGSYFPWTVPSLYADAAKAGSLEPVSYWIVLLTGLAGIAATYLWWKQADQSR